MENASLPINVLNDVTTSSSEDGNLTQYLATIRDLALKVVYIIIGTVGVLDNLFVIVVFALFVKISEKVCRSHSCMKSTVSEFIRVSADRFSDFSSFSNVYLCNVLK